MGEETHQNGTVELGGDGELSDIGALKRRIEEGRPLMVKAYGTSMHPFIRNGEPILVQRISPGEIRPGDVVFFQSDGRFFAHRVIRLHTESEAGIRIITKGDTLRHPDKPITGGDIIGRVVAVYRHGRLVNLDTRWKRLAGRLIGRVTFVYGWIFDHALALRRRLISTLTRYKPFRELRRRLSRAQIRYRPMREEEMDRLAVLLMDASPGASFEEARAMARREFEKVLERGCFYYVAEIRGDIVGAFMGGEGMILPEMGLGGWWIMGLYVRSTHRGLGIGEGLARALIEQARREGASEVLCDVFETNTASRRLFEKIGFVRADPELEAALNRYYKRISANMPTALALRYPLR